MIVYDLLSAMIPLNNAKFKKIQLLVEVFLHFAWLLPPSPLEVSHKFVSSMILSNHVKGKKIPTGSVN
jgi:hypothetical protein